MKIDFIDRISALEKIQKKELIEKDIILHQILLDLSKESFSDDFLFKGGTCLIKHYLGYFRFSEDLDYTWKDQNRFTGMTKGEVIKELQGIIEQTGLMLENIAKKRKLDFTWDKGNRDYVEMTNGGKICTFKIYYESLVLKKKIFLKVQINFVDQLCLNSKKGDLHSLIQGKYSELEGLFEEYPEYASAIPFGMYDIQDIQSEKIRALLTRRAVKARDFLDVFLISKILGIKPEDVEECTIEKIKFALENYERFRNNFDTKKKLLEEGDIFQWGDEKELLIREIDEREFNSFVEEFTKYLQELVKKFDV